MHLCYVKSAQGQQHSQVAPVGKAGKIEEKLYIQNISIIEPFTSCILLLNTKHSKEMLATSLGTSFKLLQILHKVKAVHSGKGLGKANVSTYSCCSILPDLTQKKRTVRWARVLEMSPKTCLKG